MSHGRMFIFVYDVYVLVYDALTCSIVRLLVQLITERYKIWVMSSPIDQK